METKSRRKKIILTIIALGNTPTAITQLQEMSAKRQGSFVWINNHEDAKTRVLEEIKLHAKK